ncbi:hypothetical protein KAH55_13150, partial [bacterium]|nr:hypothetical protein [bacterium]
ATGPKTKAGKDRVRLNGWKHGLTAQPHLLPPAKPGKFPECKNCDEIEACKAGEYKYCIKQVYTIAHYLEAYESGDVDKMRGLAATTQAKTKAVLDRVLNHILEHGVMLKEQLFDPEGNPLTSASGQPAVRYVKNALLKELQPLIKIVGFEATEQLMTPKSAEEQEALTGHLAATQTEQEDLRGFREKMEADRERLLRIMEQNEQKSNKSGGAGGEGDSALSG